MTRLDSEHKPVPIVTFGPVVTGWGSWDWIGADMVEALDGAFRTRTFQGWENPRCDVLVVVKHVPPQDWVEFNACRAALIYCPVDSYGSAKAIDADAALLRRCSRIVVHCERLRRYFEPYAPVQYLDHHIKFAPPLREQFRPEGDLLWVGVRTNLPALVAWVNAHPLPSPLDVVTNLEDPRNPPSPAEIGFLPDTTVRIHDWSPERQIALTESACGIIDIKGDDFRSRHKPPAKGIDAIASGVPLAMNPESSTVEHLANMGFEVASPLDTEWWFSRAYWEETRRFGRALRELLSRERVARRMKRIIEAVVSQRRPVRSKSRHESMKTSTVGWGT